MEKRLLLAFVLSAAIFAIWSVLFPPSKPPRDDMKPVVEEPAPATSENAERGVGETSTESTTADPVEPEPEIREEVVEASTVQVLTLENDVVFLELTNQGSAIQSLQLKGFFDDEGKPLELVQTVEIEARLLPLQVLLDGESDTRKYVAEPIQGGYLFHWADGSGEAIEKRIQLRPNGYGVDVQLAYRGKGRELVMAVGTGMRDRGEKEQANRFSIWGHGIVQSDGDLERYKREKTDEPVEVRAQNIAFAGFEDTYFLNIFRPETPIESVKIQPLLYTPEQKEEGSEAEETRVLRLAVQATDGALRGELLSVPKEYDLLQRIGEGVDETLEFGFFHPISVFFLRAVRWIYAKVGNYGLAIILLTLAIRIVLFPLAHKSTVSMRKMQKLQPMIKAIQDKYRKNKSDPQVRAKMQQETMELYRREGANPVGGCLPLLVQLPILFSLYTLFAKAIELRHAPFIFWITDLSAKDPIYITPILMTATMWLQQKMAPQAGDPQQQKIFRMMPLIFGIMFLGFPSGLVLYWLTNNILMIFQQEITLRLIGERNKGGSKKAGTRSKKK
jgi:YidC/Oxa1 family membrane protein insertase